MVAEVTLEDITGNSNPEALGLYVYAGEVPDDLSTQLKSTFSKDGTYSAVISSHDLKECLLSIIVQCTSRSAARYRIVPKLTPAYIGSHGVQGYLCGGGWAYHYATTAAAAVAPAGEGGDGGHGRRQLSGASGKHARFHVLLHTGDAYYITKHDSVPLKLIPPYGHVEHGEHSGIHTDSCDVAEGEHVYIGLKGARECVDYEVTVEW